MTAEIGPMFRVKIASLGSPAAYSALTMALTLKPKSGEKFGFGEGDYLPLYREVADTIEIPRQYGLREFGAKGFSDTTVEGDRVKFYFTMPLRDEQKPLVDDFLAKLQTPEGKYGGVFSAPCGTGKTVMAYKFLSEIGRPAIILVHTGALMKQWREAALKFTDLTPDQIGLAQQDECDWRGKRVVLAMVESLVRRKYEPDFYRHFGVVVADEVHRHGAAEWHRSLTQFPARVRIGLSATPRRWDGLWDVVRWHIGEVLTKGGEWAMRPRVFTINTGVALSPAFYSMRGGKINLSKLITMLTKIESRNQLIVGELVNSIRAGNRTLVLSDRLAHLAVMEEMFHAEWRRRGAPPEERVAKLLMMDDSIDGVKVGRYVGGITDAQIDHNRTCNLLFGTMQYAKEGLDDPSVDTLFLTAPKGDVEQPVGRVLRKVEGKKEPFVIDFVDEKTGPCVGFARSRQNQYRRLGFPVTEISRSVVQNAH